MAEEFQESEVIFPDTKDNCFNFQEMIVSPATASATNIKSGKKRNNNNNKKKKKKMHANSLPVNIPDMFSRFRDKEDDDRYQHQDEEWDDDDDDDDGGELVPPHVIVGRRIAGQMAFSVCTGNGRTLKGRDLSQVRNSILRMTGFLET